MGIIDLILNLACVLLWFNWRSAQVTARRRSSPVSLAATLKKAEPRASSRWLSFGMLLAILAARSLFYWNVGSTWNWTPNLELVAISLPFRSAHLPRMFLFSFLSFALVLAALYSWLLLLGVVNRTLPEDEAFQRLVRVHLGWIDRWPTWTKLMLPGALVTVLWIVANPGLAQMRIVPAPASISHVVQQALLLGLTSYLSWKPLLVGICLLYVANSYVYLGSSQFWRFVNSTGANLLHPMRRLPLRLGKIDFAPLLALVALFALGRVAAPWLPRLFQRLPL